MTNKTLANFFRGFFGSSSSTLATPAPEYRVCESTAGNYSYHLQRDSRTRSLCGKPVMHTAIPLTAWGHTGELHERWCQDCMGLMNNK